MEIIHNGLQASVKGPAEHFTGNVRDDPHRHSASEGRQGG